MNTTLTNLFLLAGIVSYSLLLIAAILFITDKAKQRIRRFRKRKYYKQEEEREFVAIEKTKRIVQIVTGDPQKIGRVHDKLIEIFDEEYISFEYLMHPSGSIIMIASIETSRTDLVNNIQDLTPEEKMKQEIRLAFKDIPAPKILRHPNSYWVIKAYKDNVNRSILLSIKSVNDQKVTEIFNGNVHDNNGIIIQGFPVIDPNNMYDKSIM